MTHYRFNKVLLLFLVTAFLTVQWTTAHIHLAEHHDHDGSHHQHDIQAHAHHSSDHHADSVDSSDVTGDHDVVELDHECSSPCWKNLGDQPVASGLPELRLMASSQSSGVILPEADDNKQSYLTYSTIRLRAPPQFS
jgi:hypothetical protein